MVARTCLNVTLHVHCVSHYKAPMAGLTALQNWSGLY